MAAWPHSVNILLTFFFIKNLVKFSPLRVFFLSHVFSHRASNDECYISFDDGTITGTLVGVKSVNNDDGYNSYYMESRTIPTLSSIESQTGKIYWRNTVDDLQSNADLSGIASANECFKACHVVTDDNCWIFR